MPMSSRAVCAAVLGRIRLSEAAERASTSPSTAPSIVGTFRDALNHESPTRYGSTDATNSKIELFAPPRDAVDNDTLCRLCDFAAALDHAPPHTPGENSLPPSNVRSFAVASHAAAMPPAFGDADDGRGDYNSDFKKKARARRGHRVSAPHATAGPRKLRSKG